ncbi:MAG: hypothetical protein QW579_06935 [Desulfurococcaceae archaeon]
MSYQVINLGIRMAHAHVIDTTDNALYELSNVTIGGNWRLIKCSLNPFNCQILDSGVQVPSTDVHFNPWSMLSDDNYVYALISRWSGLMVYRFSKTTGAGTYMGTVNPAGHTDLNYFQMIKIREDRYYAIARTGGGRTTTLFAFDGQPAELLDARKWTKIGNVHNDEGVGPSTCMEGGINFTYAELHQFERYVAIHSFTRCPPSPHLLKRSVLVFYDPVKEKLYNAKFEEVQFNQSTLNDSISVDVTNPVTTAYRRDIGPAGLQFMVTPGGRIFITYMYIDSNNRPVSMGIAKGLIGYQQLTYVPLNMRVYPVAADIVGNVILYASENVPQKKYVYYDAGADAVADIIITGEPGGFTERHKVFCKTQEFHIPCNGFIWAHDYERFVLPPNYPNVPGLEIINTLDLTSPSANALRVRASFVRPVDFARVEVYNTQTSAKVVEEDINGPLSSIDKTYTNVQPGKYRAVISGRKLGQL